MLHCRSGLPGSLLLKPFQIITGKAVKKTVIRLVISGTYRHIAARIAADILGTKIHKRFSGLITLFCQDPAFIFIGFPLSVIAYGLPFCQISRKFPVVLRIFLKLSILGCCCFFQLCNRMEKTLQFIFAAKDQLPQAVPFPFHSFTLLKNSRPFLFQLSDILGFQLL